MKIGLQCTAIVSIAMLVGCNKTLDFRNAEISNNKIYATGENSGFSGKVTNIPFSKIPFANIVPVSNMIGKVSGFKTINDIIYLNSLPVVRDGGVLCDTTAKDGMLSGEVVCKISTSGAPFITLRFESNSLQGEATFFNPNKSGSTLAKASFADGQADGKMTIFGQETGKSVYTLDWQAGKITGNEEMIDEKTGNVTFRGTLVNGQYEGESSKFTPDGTLIDKTMWLHGVPQQGLKTSAAASSDATSCVDLWIGAFRKEQGPEAAIASDQIEEWKTWCAEGKKPNT